VPRLGRHSKHPPFERTGIQVVGGYITAYATAAHVSAAIANDNHPSGYLRRARARIRQLVINDCVSFPNLPPVAASSACSRPSTDATYTLPFHTATAAIDEVATRIAGSEMGCLGVITPDLSSVAASTAYT